MKKKILGIVITLVIMMGMMVSQVNAATISASNAEVNKGDQITVTVNLENATQAIDLDLTYDANAFEYVKGSVTSGLDSLTVNDRNAGEVKISGSDPYNSTTYVTYTFVAKENTEAAEFVASGLETPENEALTVSSVSVKVSEPVVDPEPEQPAEPENPSTENPGETINNEQNGSQTNTDAPLVDENGNVITKLPQTGVNVYTVIAGVAVVAIVAVLVVRKIRK